MANTWFVRSGGKVFGPFDTGKLKQLAAAGQVSTDSEIARSHAGPWFAAKTIQGLFDALPPAEAPKPTPRPPVAPPPVRVAPAPEEQIAPVPPAPSSPQQRDVTRKSSTPTAQDFK